MKTLFPILCLWFFVPGIIWSQNVTMFKQADYKNAEINLTVMDLKTKQKVVSFQTSPLVTPASVQKLVTTGAALEMLGPDYRFITRVIRTGTIENGVLNGDLRIEGSGDPTLGSKQISAIPDAFVQEWVNAIKRTGITNIRGNIVADPDVYDSEGISPFWLWEDIGNYYATGVYGLNVFDNSFQLSLSSGKTGSTARVMDIKPTIPGLTIESHLIAAANTQDSAYLYGAPFQSDMRLFGTMPAQRENFVIRGQIPDPPTLLATIVYDALKKAGVTITGSAGSTRTLDSSNQTGTVVTTTTSPPLSQLVRIIHEKSDNFYAECILRCIAAESGIKPASAVEGLRLVKSFWQKAGVSIGSLYMYDAAGLSPNNRISGEFLANLLTRIQEFKTAAVFEASLPLAGREGTVSGFLQGTTLEGHVRLKSGSNQVVQSYAGYLRKNGKSYAVVLIVNHAQASRLKIRKDMENFLLSL
jgi:serine-type D-Ala-D-Ala carboxypeptidase/endopeptidase (penicillin-binding protein 4)